MPLPCTPAPRRWQVPRTALAAFDTILIDLFALAERSLVPGGRLVFLLPTTLPFSEALLPPHPTLALEGAYEQCMAARWSRWCVVLRRRTAAEEAAAAAAAAAEAAGGQAEAEVAGSAPIFDRASLRPADSTRADSGDQPVLHPQLLHKSGRAKRKAQKEAAKGAAAAGASAGGVAHPKGAELLPAEKGARSARRRASKASALAAGDASSGALEAVKKVLTSKPGGKWGAVLLLLATGALVSWRLTRHGRR